MIWWEDELAKFFPSCKVEDLSDFDLTPDKTFYISISDFAGDFGSEEFDKFSDQDHVYYMVVNISGDESKAYLDFLKYVKGSKGTNLIMSADPFVKDQEKFKTAGIRFIDSMGLKNQHFPTSSYEVGDKPSKNKASRPEPREVQYVGDYKIYYRLLDKADEKNPEIMGKVREIFTRYEKHIGIDLKFQDFSKELADLPGDYASPKGAIILAQIMPRGSDDFDGPIELAGCVALRPIEGNICEMKRLFVDPTYRFMEIGQELARRIIMVAQKKDYKYMRLDTLATMKSAQRLYERLGFYDIDAYIYNPFPDVRYMELKL